LRLIVLRVPDISVCSKRVVKRSKFLEFGGLVPLRPSVAVVFGCVALWMKSGGHSERSRSDDANRASKKEHDFWRSLM
jgi:hypothetical protein